jgi:hypothetical protein
MRQIIARMARIWAVAIVAGHSIHVVDMQDGGGWDWTTGEPQNSDLAYVPRFCKSDAGKGGMMGDVQANDAVFTHHVFRSLPGSN